MPQFLFATTDHQGAFGPDKSYDFASLDAALNEARSALTEMAADRFPDEGQALSIRVYNLDGEILAELILEYRLERYSGRHDNNGGASRFQ